MRSPSADSVVAAPPDPFDATEEILPAGSRLYRVHPLQVDEVDEELRPTGAVVLDDGTLFNPGFGRTRFAFFGQPPVPVWYAASGPEGAVFESLLHDKVPGGSLPRAQWAERMLSVAETTHDLRLAKLHSDGLRKYDLTAARLTDTPPTTYSETVRWAHEAWLAGYDGCSWVSKQYNSQFAYVLFGTATVDLGGPDGPLVLGPELGAPPAKLRAVADAPETRVFAVSRADFDWLAEVCWSMRVTTTL